VRASFASSGSFVESIPPSPVVIDLRGWNEKQAASPSAPAWTPPMRVPSAHAASSSTHRPCRSATAFTAPIAAARPNRWTGMIPTVRSVTSPASRSGSRLKLSSVTSQNTGVAPTYSTTFAVDTHVNAGTITSSPGPAPSAATPMWSAVVHDVVATACSTPVKAAKRRSNSATRGPCATQPERSGSWTAAISSSAT
jgi:hypothetical protein